jgi:dihydrofolate synthase/folylpolyglutamate synthase
LSDELAPDYLATLERLQARGRFGMRLGLSRTRALLQALGDPHVSLRGALIGGTNGKGSTQALVASVLREGGLRVGQTPKPHLVSYRERIQISGEPISVADFCVLLDEVMAVDEKLTGLHGPSTEFEVLTSAAFLHFARVGVDVGVIEVGIGGRLDATNVWQGGISAITNVALDHMEILGETIEAIAAEKAQIIKPGDVTAVTGAVEPGLGVIRERARQVNVPLEVVEPLVVDGMSRTGVRVRAPGGEPLTIGLLGEHQAANAAVAWVALDGLAAAGIAATNPEQRSAGFANARWPGRLELISQSGRPAVLLDGAHNPHGVSALAAALRTLLPQLSGGAPSVVMAIMANHWQAGMLDPLLSIMPNAAVFATNVPESANSLPPSRLALEWGPGARAVADPDSAIDAALANARATGGMLIVCGSLYLVGHVRAQLTDSAPAA